MLQPKRDKTERRRFPKAVRRDFARLHRDEIGPTVGERNGHAFLRRSSNGRNGRPSRASQGKGSRTTSGWKTRKPVRTFLLRSLYGTRSFRFGRRSDSNSSDLPAFLQPPLASILFAEPKGVRW